MKRGLLTLSADPVTYGHLDLIQRAAALCDELLVAVLPSHGKNYALPESERLSLLQFCLDDLNLKNLKVFSSKTPLIDIYFRENCSVLFRGIRNAEDKKYEDQQVQYHRMSCPGVDFHVEYIDADPALEHIQSTVVRNFATNNFQTLDMAPMKVQARLWRHLNGQKMLGVCGARGCGKSTVIQGIVGVLQAEGVTTTVVDLRDLEKELQAEDSPGAKYFRDQAEEAGFFNTAVDRLKKTHLYRLYRDKIRGKKGLILLEGSELVSGDYLPWVNNNVLFINSDLNTDTVSNCDLETHKAQQEKYKYGVSLVFDHKRDEFPNEAGELVLAWVRKGDF